MLIIILVACKNENNYIIPTDFSFLIPDSTTMANGITEKQMQKRTEDFVEILTKNTLNHEIPNATIFDLNETQHKLKDQLSKTKLIISTSVTCAWNLDGILTDFPTANKRVHNPIHKSEIVLLIHKEENDYYDEQFKRNIKEIKDYYSNVFLIDSIQSLKLNLFGLSRYYISKQHMVLDIGRGTWDVKLVQDELEKNMGIN